MRAATSSARTYLHTLARRDEITWAVESFLSTVDAWILSRRVAAGVPPSPTQADRTPAGRRRRAGRRNRGHDGPHPAPPSHLTGHPVVVLPLPHPDGTLPLGVQVVGRLWQDSELLAVAQALTGVTGGYQPPPGFA